MRLMGMTYTTRRVSSTTSAWGGPRPASRATTSRRPRVRSSRSIARETAKLDAVRAATERTVALLKERRSALIAAAVTGQLDVGSAA